MIDQQINFIVLSHEPWLWSNVAQYANEVILKMKSTFSPLISTIPLQWTFSYVILFALM